MHIFYSCRNTLKTGIIEEIEFESDASDSQSTCGNYILTKGVRFKKWCRMLYNEQSKVCLYVGESVFDNKGAALQKIIEKIKKQIEDAEKTLASTKTLYEKFFNQLTLMEHEGLSEDSTIPLPEETAQHLEALSDHERVDHERVDHERVEQIA